jgi:hypothetical protein
MDYINKQQNYLLQAVKSKNVVFDEYMATGWGNT